MIKIRTAITGEDFKLVTMIFQLQVFSDFGEDNRHPVRIGTAKIPNKIGLM